MSEPEVISFGAITVLALAHVMAPWLRFLRLVPRSRLLSAASGISVAYVIVHLLPEVAEAQDAVDERATGLVANFERHAYVAALVGLAVFYGLERAAVLSRTTQGTEPAGTGDPPTSPAAFWVSAASFGVYNAIIGYLVVRRAEDDSLTAVLLFTVAIGVHFMVNDLGLRHHHKHRYDRVGRPLLVTALALGWITGTVTQISEAAIGIAVAFLAGGILLNVMKEELPEERNSRFLPLVAGMGVYAAVLLAI